MSDATQLAQTLQSLTVRLLALRDVTICLLAAQARTKRDKTALFREISEGLDERLAQAIQPSASAGAMQMAEQVRSEIDRIIGMAQRALGPE